MSEPLSGNSFSWLNDYRSSPEPSAEAPTGNAFDWLNTYRKKDDGLLEAGNIDLALRPRVTNPDGSVSTVRSVSFGQDGREILVPTVADDGTNLTLEQAVEAYRQNGKHLGIFSSPAAATAYAQRLHEQQAAELAKPRPPLVGPPQIPPAVAAMAQNGGLPTANMPVPEEGSVIGDALRGSGRQALKNWQQLAGAVGRSGNAVTGGIVRALAPTKELSEELSRPFLAAAEGAHAPPGMPAPPTWKDQPVMTAVTKVAEPAAGMLPYLMGGAASRAAIPAMMFATGYQTGKERAEEAGAAPWRARTAGALQGAVDAALGSFLPARLSKYVSGEIAAGSTIGKAALKTAQEMLSGTAVAGAQMTADEVIAGGVGGAETLPPQDIAMNAFFMGIAGALAHPVAKVREMMETRAGIKPTETAAAPEVPRETETASQAEVAAPEIPRAGERPVERPPPPAEPVVEVTPRGPDPGGLNDIKTSGIAEAVAAPKRVSEMTPEEMHRALLTDEVTGLPNRRAYDEKQASGAGKPVKAFIDLDSFKGLNTVIGHEGADKVVAAVGEAARAIGLGDNLHRASKSGGGDEFVGEFDSPEQAEASVAALRQMVNDAVVHVQMPDGTTKSFTGADFSHGIGGDLAKADTALKANKEERTASGLRSSDREAPPVRFRPVGAEGSQRTVAPGSESFESGTPEAAAGELKPETENGAENPPEIRAGEALPDMETPPPGGGRGRSGGFIRVNLSKALNAAAGNWLDINNKVEPGENLRATVTKWLRSGGVLPTKAHEIIETHQGLIKANQNEIAKDSNALKKVIGKNKVLALRVKNYILEPSQRAQYARLIPDEARTIADSMIERLDALAKTVANEPGLVTKAMGATLEARAGSHLVRGYEVHNNQKWLKKLRRDKTTWNSIRADLAASPEGQGKTMAELDGMIEEAATGSDDSNVFGKGAGGAGTSDTALSKHRQDIPLWMRRAMGEYDDPSVQYYQTAQRLQRNLNTHRMYTELSQLGESEGWLRPADKGPSAGLATPIRGGSETPGHGTRNPMGGKYTSRFLAEAIQGADREVHGRFYQLLRDWTAQSKIAKTLQNMQGQARNWIANVPLSAAAGNNMIAVKLGNATGLHVMPWSRLRRPIPNRRLLGLGVGGSSVDLGDIQRSSGRKSDTLAASAFDRANKMLADVWAYGDDTPKSFGVENETAKQMWIDPSLSRPEAERIAAGYVKNMLPTYSRMVEALKAVQANPLTGLFVGFPSEVVRVLKNIGVQGLKESLSSNPRERVVGAHRLASLTATLAAPTLAVAAAKAMFERRHKGKDYDKTMAAVRALSPDFLHNSQLLVLNAPGDGTARIVDLSFVDPFTQFRNIWNSAMAPVAGGADRTKFKKAMDAIKTAADPYVGEGIGTSEVIDVLRNRTRYGAPVYTEGATLWSKALDSALHLATSVEPGVLVSAQRIYKAANDIQDSPYRKYELGPEVMALFGPRQMTIDARRTLHFSTVAFSSLTSQATRMQNKSEDEGISEFDKQRRSGDAESAIKAAAEGLYQAVQGAKGLGLSEDDIQDLLTKERVASDYRDAVLESSAAIIQAWSDRREAND